MKRLILVGNGFDLAHDLKTSYCDFISWYLSEALNKFYNSNEFEDELLSIRHKNVHQTLINNSLPTIPDYSLNIFKGILNYTDSYIVIFKSKLFKQFINKAHIFNWVDIELEYFDFLSENQKLGVNINPDLIKIINHHFGIIKLKLEEYLCKQEFEFNDYKPDEDILNILKSEFIWRDFDTGIEKGEGKDFRLRLKSDDKNFRYPTSTLFLNFNYTNTLENYVNELKKYEFQKNMSINYIHGKLKQNNNPIIFGFGDEYNAKYKLLEEQSNNDVFEHMKSYWYFKSSNYRELIRYLNSDMFQVFILGHSCGLSDRTMFREIFNHENCKSVKIFYYVKPDGTSDYFDKTVQLGRHFGNNGRMRKKIVEFNESTVFPQPKLNA